MRATKNVNLSYLVYLGVDKKVNSRLHPALRYINWNRVDLLDCYMFCGIHTLKVSISIAKYKLFWGNKKKYRFRDPETGTYLTRIEYKRWNITPNLRLIYNRGGYLLLEFEPLGDFPDESTGLLPFNQFIEAWSSIKDVVSEAVRVPDLFKHSEIRLSHLDYAFDIKFNDPNLIVKSLRNLPVDRRLSEKIKFIEEKGYLQFRTENSSKALCIYNREEKPRGHHILRLEFRYRNRRLLDSAFGFGKGRFARPEDLTDYSRVSKFALDSFYRYGIFPLVDYVPLRVAEEMVCNKFVMRSLKTYNDWSKGDRFRYHVGRLRDNEKLVVGSTELKRVAMVSNLYEGLWEAFKASWEGSY